MEGDLLEVVLSGKIQFSYFPYNFNMFPWVAPVILISIRTELNAEGDNRALLALLLKFDSCPSNSIEVTYKHMDQKKKSM